MAPAADHNPLVSIVVRTKDRPKLLERALASIAAQTYRPIEVVLVNDGGGVLDVEDIKTLLGDVSLNYQRLEKNRGRAHAGNVGIESARGEYIGFLDDDDEYYPEHVATAASALHSMEHRVVYTDCEMVHRQYDPGYGDFTETARHVFASRDFSIKNLLLENYIPLISLLFHRSVFAVETGFDVQFLAYEDWDFLIRCAGHFPFCHIPKVTTQYIQWSRNLQIGQSDTYAGLREREYDKVVIKHRDKYTPDVVRHFRDTLAGHRAALRKQEVSLAEKHDIIGSLENALTARDADASALRATAADLEGRLRNREDYISRIHAGRGWRLLTAYYRMRDRLFHGPR